MHATSAPEPMAPDRIIRHRQIDRLYHWGMAITVLVLLATGFLPIVGVKFSWLAPHWIAGLVLVAVFAFHIVRVTIREDIWAMVVVPADLREAWRRVPQLVGCAGMPLVRSGKYPLLQKLYHAGVAAAVLSTVVTGLPMMVKIDGPFWTRNPYWLSETTWGVIYVVHDLTAMATLSIVMIHVYFALRPEKFWLTRAMVLGWITRREYLEHYDPARWAADQVDPGAVDSATTWFAGQG